MPRMDAEIVTNAPYTEPLIATLTKLGFEMEVIDWLPTEENGTTIIAAQFTELDADAFFDEITRITEPFDVTLMGAGMVERPSPVVARPGVFRRHGVWLG
ncbi:hypothetical protein [Bradyrhizobium sp. F1.13.3]|uniref:hypothetical protein n=1 Tax=Bradyrhizobium sp. F1.13.3 TaxID=3156351 RepID=UPI003395DC11